jgi:hypothetical protein
LRKVVSNFEIAVALVGSGVRMGAAPPYSRWVGRRPRHAAANARRFSASRCAARYCEIASPVRFSGSAPASVARRQRGAVPAWREEGRKPDAITASLRRRSMPGILRNINDYFFIASSAILSS